MTVNFWGEQREIDPAVLDEEVEHVYTRGQCHALARAIHEITGWELAVMVHGSGEGANVRYDGDHVICIMPDGRAIDVRGPQLLSEIEAEWCLSAVPVDLDTVIDLPWDRQDMEPAREVAKTVLNRFNCIS